jgi:hypothetical protein
MAATDPDAARANLCCWQDVAYTRHCARNWPKISSMIESAWEVYETRVATFLPILAPLQCQIYRDNLEAQQLTGDFFCQRSVSHFYFVTLAALLYCLPPDDQPSHAKMNTFIV